MAKAGRGGERGVETSKVARAGCGGERSVGDSTVRGAGRVHGPKIELIAGPGASIGVMQRHVIGVPSIALGLTLVALLIFPGVARAEQFDVGIPCVEHEDCDDSQYGPYCDQGMCHECLEDVHCPEGGVCTEYNRCIFPCGMDEQCPPQLPLCNTEASQCVGCLADDDCAADHYCGASGTCLAQVCEPGTWTCVGNTRRQCNDSGSAFEALDDCGIHAMCVTADGEAWCEAGVGSSTGSAVDGMGPTSGAGPGSGTRGGGTGDGAQDGEPLPANGCVGRRVPAANGSMVWGGLLLLAVARRRQRRTPS